MKQEVTQIKLNNNAMVLSVSLLASLRQLGEESGVTSNSLPASLLSKLKVTLETPYKIGVRTLDNTSTENCYYTINDNVLNIHLSDLVAGMHRVLVTIMYGTNTKSLLLANIIVPQNAGTQVETHTLQLDAVEQIGDGGGGSSTDTEVVTVNLSLPDGANPVDWTSYHVTLERLSAGIVSAIDINADGVATFEIPAGEIFALDFPVLEDYTAPVRREYVAVAAEKSIAYTYSTDPNLEHVVVFAHSTTSGLGSLIGESVVLTTNSGINETRTFDSDLKVEFDVPYGDEATIELPQIDGLAPNSRYLYFTADSIERDIVAYYESSHIGVFGRDAAGNWYHLNDNNQLVDDDENVIADPSVVEFVALNTSAMDMSKRDVTGNSTGNGFMVQCGTSLIGGLMWADQNVEFDTSLLPFAQGYRGYKNTEYIRAYGDEHNIGTPAADAAYNRTISFKGDTHHGFFLAILQQRAYNQNYAALNAIATAAGRTIPSIASVNMWSSDQFSADRAYFMQNGSLNNTTKRTFNNVLVAYDLL